MENKQKTSGISFPSLLGITFLILKLTEVIDWPWIWVLSPFWIPVAVALLFIVIGLVIWGNYGR